MRRPTVTELVSDFKVIGVDPSFAACGLACVRLQRITDDAGITVRASEVKLLGHATIRTDSTDDHADRLWDLHVGVREFMEKHGASLYAVEGFAFGAKFQREVQGMVHGAILVSLRVGGAAKIEVVTPMQAKKVACPEFPGWSKANWSKAGYTQPFKRSMPEKATVMSGLRRRFGFVGLVDDAVADAACVAIAAGYRSFGVDPGA